jgi:hypothetical protein
MGWSWNDVTAAADATNSNSAVAEPEISAYVFASQGTQHVIYGTEYGRVHELWWDASGWHLNDLSAAANAPPVVVGTVSAYVFDAQRTQHVNFIGDDFHIHELWWDVSGWHHNDLTNATGTPSGIGLGPGEPEPAGYVFAGTQHVNYRRDDGHVIELWWDATGWYFNDLTLAACATDVPNSAVIGYGFDVQGTQHVIYRGNDDHIIELWWGNGVWNVNDLTVAAGAPLAYSRYSYGPSGYVFDDTQHVNYLGQDFHIHELWWDSNGWHHNDLTIAAGADPANDDAVPIGYAFASQGTQHVIYLGSDAHIHELWWDSNGWHHNDLTLASGAPAISFTTCVPVGYAFDAQGTQHVFYRDSNLHVTELYWVP